MPHFVSQGGLAVSCSYRLAPKHAFPAHVQDANNALRWVRKNIESFGGNPNCIIVAGGSAGAHLSSLMATSTLDLHGPNPAGSIKGVLGIYGVFEWGLGHSDDDARFRKFLSSVVLGKRDHPDEFRHASPFHWVGERKSFHLPTLLLHGSSDNIVGIEASRRFHRLLSQKGANSIFVNLILAQHAFDFFHSLRSLAVNYYATEWLFHVAEMQAE